jgi:hypothetical protein
MKSQTTITIIVIIIVVLIVGGFCYKNPSSCGMKRMINYRPPMMQSGSGCNSNIDCSPDCQCINNKCECKNCHSIRDCAKFGPTCNCHHGFCKCHKNTESYQVSSPQLLGVPTISYSYWPYGDSTIDVDSVYDVDYF